MHLPDIWPDHYPDDVDLVDEDLDRPDVVNDERLVETVDVRGSVL